MFYKGFDTYICDTVALHIKWLERYAPMIKAVQTASYPTLPFSDGYFDIISAYSVFTHIDEVPLHWLLELRRITKSGGTLCLTFLDEHAWLHYRGNEEELGRLAIDEPEVSELVKGDIPSSPFILQYKAGYANVFYKRDSLFSTLSKYFSRVRIVPGGHNFQTIALLNV